MSYWSMEIFWTFDDKQKINLYVKLQDQFVQPDQSGFIDQARDRHHAFIFFQFSILFSFCPEQRRYEWYNRCVKELLAPLVWHSLCLTYDHTTLERSVFIDNQLILQDKLRNY